MTKKTTLADIAKAANVSLSTVSRILSGSNYPVSDETLQKVEKAVLECNYYSNNRVFAVSRAKEIVFIVPNLQNQFYIQIFMGIESEARSYGDSVSLLSSSRQPEIERAYIEKIKSRNDVKGIIISSIDPSTDTIKGYIDSGGKIAVLNQYDEGPATIVINNDSVPPASIAVDFLVSMGHKNIAFLSPPLEVRSRQVDLEAFKVALLKHGIDLNERNIVVTDCEIEINNEHYEYETGKELARKFCEITPRPTAIFTVSDEVAYGVMGGLREAGVRIPGDVSIIGSDDLHYSKMTVPALTTINQNAYDLGRAAYRMFKYSLDTQKDVDGESCIRMSIQSNLVVRDSVKRIKIQADQNNIGGKKYGKRDENS